VPAILHVNQESRHEGQRKFPLLFGGEFASPQWFDPFRDSLHLREIGVWGRIKVEENHLAQVRHLVMYNRPDSILTIFYVHGMLAYEKLETLSIARGDESIVIFQKEMATYMCGVWAETMTSKGGKAKKEVGAPKVVLLNRDQIRGFYNMLD